MTWTRPPGALRLERGSIDVWRVSLARAEQEVAALESHLSNDERDRARRMLTSESRLEIIVARATLRRILGSLLGADPRSIAFEYGPHGKPAIAGGGEVQFNVAHTRGLALIAVTAGRRIGVDVERMRPDVEHESLARRFFSARESAELLSLPAGERTAAFFRCWTRKEAVLKATGKGIAGGLASFDVSLRPGEPAALLRAAWGAGETPGWTLVDLDAGPGYAAALACEGPGVAIRCWESP